MQSRSTAFDTLYNSGAYVVLPSLSVSQLSGTDSVIGNDKLISMSITGSLFAEETLSFGGCTSRELSVRFYLPTTITIPRMGKLAAKLTLASNPASSGQSITKGTFFVDTRKYDSESGIMEIVAYDSMLKTEQPMIPEGTVPTGYPKTMSAVVSEIATAIGVTVDPRTDLENWQVLLPTSLSMREVLGYIAAVHCGNWVITPENKLRLIRVGDTLDTVPVGRAMTSFTVGDAFQTITHVIINIDEDTYIEAVAAQDTGRTIEVTCPWGTQAMANAMLSELASYTYQPYTASGTMKHPAAEIGDKVTVNGYTSQIVSETFYFNSLMKSDIAAPGEQEVNHEYPYQTQTKSITKKLTTATHDLQITVNGLQETVSDLEGDITAIAIEAGKIAWLVRSGTSSTNFTLTPRVAQLVTETLRLEAGEATFPGELDVENITGSSYRFVYDDTSGYYKSNNQGINSSAAVCRIGINALEDTTLVLVCVNYAESTYDYGMISKVDISFDPTSIDESSTKIFHTFRTENSPDPVEIEIPVTAGEHFVDVKFRKDGSQAANNDAFWFKFGASPGMDGTSVLTLKSGSTELSSATIRISGMVTFADLSGSGTTIINGDNIVSGTITGTTLISKSDPIVSGTRAWYDCVSINDGNIRFYGEKYSSVGGDLMKTVPVAYLATTLDTDELGNDVFSITSQDTISMLIHSQRDLHIQVANKMYIDFDLYPEYAEGMALMIANRDGHVEWDYPVQIGRLWRGTLVNVGDSASFNSTGCSGFIVIGSPSNGGYRSSVFIPMPSSSAEYQIADRSDYVTFEISQDTIELTDTYSDGQIYEVWGI